MKSFKKSLLAFAAVLMGTCLVSCGDANEYEDADTRNPSFAGEYNDSMTIAHPESGAETYWVRGAGLKVNAYGEDIQGYVESLDFLDDTYVVVKMSQADNMPESIKSTATWTDESNTDALPKYEYVYSQTTGKIEILKEVKDDKGKVSKMTIFTAVAISQGSEIVTVTHFGDTPSQTYLVKAQKPEAPAADEEVQPAE